MSDKRKPWERTYGLSIKDLSQYQPLIDEKTAIQIRLNFEDNLVNSAPGPIGLMVDTGSKNVTVGHDGQGHLSIDQIDQNTARIRPLSYLFHTRCYRALDVPQSLALGGAEQHATLRQRLTEFGAPHNPDSDLFPCKIGMSCLIVAGERGKVKRILTTRRAKDLALYGGMQHSSFSGGAEVSEIDNNTQSLADLLSQTAVRECEEELKLTFDPDEVRVLGVWRDLERLSAQAFGVVYVRDGQALRPTTNNELTSWKFEKPKKSKLSKIWDWALRIPGESPELRMFRELIATKFI